MKSNWKETVWKRYAMWTMPIVSALIIVINWQIYSNVTESDEITVQKNAIEVVELQAKALANVFESHKNTTQKLFRGFSRARIDEYMKRADEFVKSHPQEYDGYVRLTFRDGKSYTSNRGLDSINFKGFYVPNRIFNDKAPFVMTSPYNHVDGVKVKHYGIHHPLIVNDSIVAVITTTIPRTAIDGPVSQLNLNGNGVPGIIASPSLNVIFQGSDNGIPVDTSVFEESGLRGLAAILEKCNSSAKDGQCLKFKFERFTDDGVRKMDFYCAYINGSNLGVNLAIADSEINYNSRILMIIIITLSVTSIFIYYFVLRLITKKIVLSPIDKANKFAKEFSEGKLYTNEINNIVVENEFGEMKENMTVMKNKLVEVVENIREAANKIKNGNESLIKSVNEIEEGAQLQSVNTEQISASIENIMMSVQQINENARDAALVSDEVSSDITSIAQYSQKTLETIENVIGKIAIINDITQRTDLLAINASVEAARAGEFGKGFSQVAHEIRKLAEVCQTASSEINELSAQSLRITQISVNLVTGIEPKVKDNADMVNDISQSCVEQIQLANSMALPIQRLVEITSSNSSNADELAQQVNILGNNCQKLVDSVHFFKTKEEDDDDDIVLAQLKECSDEISRLNELIARTTQTLN